MLQRQLKSKVIEAAKQYPIVTILGPRQSGKSTLAKQAFPDYRYVSLEDPDHRAHAKNDPRDFLQQYDSRVIIDEVQRVPDLFSYLQTHTDEKNTVGQYILTGSEQFELGKNMTQTLAGRTAIMRLLPLSLSEMYQRAPQTCWVGGVLQDTITKPEISKYQAIWQGGYPRIQQQDIDPFQFHRDYVDTYVSRDVRKILDIGNLNQFELFMRLLAGRAGQLVNYNDLSRDVGVSNTTIKRWISVLEQSFLITTLQPYYKNFNKRQVKSPKLYFLDTGLLCYLLGIRHPEQLMTHPLVGSIFENYAYSEMLKSYYNCAEKPNAYFWATVAGELDVIFEVGYQQQVTSEIKLAATMSDKFFKSSKDWRLLNIDAKQSQYLVYGGGEKQQRQGVIVLPWFMIS